MVERMTNSTWGAILVFWEQASPHEEEVLPDQMFSGSLRDLHQHAGSLQPLLPSSWGVPDRTVHLRARPQRRLLPACLHRETSRFPVRLVLTRKQKDTVELFKKDYVTM